MTGVPPKDPAISIVDAHAPPFLTAAGELFLEYARGLPFSLEYQGFSQELASLPGKYAPPLGAILLALDRPTLPSSREPRAALGCVALRPHKPGECELKRFYVRPEARGRGLGHLLASAAVQRARSLGYRSICLDSSEDMHAARRVYEAAGFKPCDRYNDDPDPTTVYYRLAFAGA
ncbi:MAG: GNAT family N-acetyltransferase [Phycisphaerae bacterium]|nr:GNAT family N-acetyltransferase [Phycisphaerae bacterium]